MDILDTVLPFFVDYLGCYEIGINGIENPYDVMKGMNKLKNDFRKCKFTFFPFFTKS